MGRDRQRGRGIPHVPGRVLRARLLDRPPARLPRGQRLELDVVLVPVRMVARARASTVGSANDSSWLARTMSRSWSVRWMAGSTSTSRRVHAGSAAAVTVAAAPPSECPMTRSHAVARAGSGRRRGRRRRRRSCSPGRAAPCRVRAGRRHPLASRRRRGRRRTATSARRSIRGRGRAARGGGAAGSPHERRGSVTGAGIAPA